MPAHDGADFSPTFDQDAAAPMNGVRALSKPIRIARLVLIIIIGGWLAWQVVTTGVAGLAVRSANPALLAAFGTPAHPDAGAMLAERLLVAGNKTAAAQTAYRMVLADPSNDRALRVLGLAKEAAGDRDAGATIMRQAAGLGWRDTPTQLWALRDAAMRDDAITVMQRADALARRNRSPELTQAVFLAALNEPRLRAALVDSLSKQPVWRTSFFANVRQRLPVNAASGMETLFRDLQARRIAIAPGEWLNYVDRLIDLGDYAHARAIWAKAFAVPAGRLAAAPYDGDFALAAVRPDGAPVSQFEWVLNPDLSGAVSFAGGTGGAALSLPTQLTNGAVIASQVVMLAPGTHQLSARIEGDASAAAAGWTITCLPSAQPLPRRLPRGADDELSTVVFDVPANGCGAQRVMLTGREQLEAQAVSVRAVRIR